MEDDQIISDHLAWPIKNVLQTDIMVLVGAAMLKGDVG